jgi:hypothetical protein
MHQSQARLPLTILMPSRPLTPDCLPLTVSSSHSRLPSAHCLVLSLPTAFRSLSRPLTPDCLPPTVSSSHSRLPCVCAQYEELMDRIDIMLRTAVASSDSRLASRLRWEHRVFPSECTALAPVVTASPGDDDDDTVRACAAPSLHPCLHAQVWV